jgi:DNA replication and repair protein RecF
MLKHIYLQDFRGYSELNADLGPGITFISGPNGHGKTNLLEALHFVTQGHSFRTRHDQELIRWNATQFTIRAEGVIHKKSHSQSVQVDSTGAKRIRFGEKESRLFSDLMGGWPLIIMGPLDIEIIQGAPAVRRRFMDTLLSQQSPLYLKELRIYNRILRQRNACLKGLVSFAMDYFEILSVQLCESAAKITEYRFELIKGLQEAIRLYNLISGSTEQLLMRYQLSYPGAESLDNTGMTLKKHLRSCFKREQALKSTQAGPHKDDLLLFLNHHPIREYGSQGQCRSAALALKSASAHLLAKQTQIYPILLLDDIFAELDESRRKAIGEIVSESPQVFITAPRYEDMPFKANQSWHIQDNKWSLK